MSKAKAIGARTERERDYIAAAGQLFADFEKVDQSTRLRAYRDAMAGVAAKYPDDPEASAFYAVALIAANDPTDRTYANLLKAGAILDRLAPAQPDHPGFVHYIIHAYDVPPLAPKAIDAARLYAKVAPSAPHALHMPSHTFTRLGYWQDSIDTNIASASAAKREKAPAEELHAMDYQAYAYLQLAQDRAALGLVDALPEIKARFDPDQAGSAAPGSAGVFALAAIPARYALERQAWSEAAALEAEPQQVCARRRDDVVRAWARCGSFRESCGSARGNRCAAETGGALAKAGRDLLDRTGRDPATRRDGVDGVQADGRTEEALTIMREAADREDRTEKSAVTPGPLAPARELLGYMLIAVKRPSDALAAFDITLAKEPNRYRALAGAVEAARQAGDPNAVKKYLEPMVALTAKADVPGRPEIAALKTGASK